MNRRSFLSLSLAALAASEAGRPALSAEPTSGPASSNAQHTHAISDLKLWYPRPATQWLEALPIGNGHLGAMVFGGTGIERIQLNESTVWAGQPHDYNHPEGLAALPQIRQLVWDDKWGEAQHLIDTSFIGKPAGQMQFQTVGDWMMDFGDQSGFRDYSRELDLNEAVTAVSYVSGGVRYRRETFASAPDRVIVVRLTADRPGSISFSGHFQSPQKTTTQKLDDRTLALNGVSGDAGGIRGAVQFHAAARAVNEGGHVTVSDDRLTVEHADSVTLLISIGTNYKNYHDLTGDPVKEPTESLGKASNRHFDDLRNRHVRDYQRLFHRVSLTLGSGSGEALPTDERVEQFAHTLDPNLAVIHFQYGRYLLISCSRPGGQPANLQGIWNDSMSPAWGSKYTININTEMNYWPAAPANLIECYEPLFGLIEDISVTGQETAKVQYGAGGWLAHHNTDIWRGTAPVDFSLSGMWPTGGAWLCKSFWDHYEFTHDLDALRHHYPIMKGAAEFFVDALVRDPHTGYLVTNPSVSPEVPHHAATNACVCAGPAMDTQIITDLFHACEQAASLLKTDSEFAAKLAATRAQLPPMKIGHLGQLQEWQEDWDASADMHNRHVSHLYWIFPGNGITRRKTPALFDAARKSLELRGDEATGWSLAWKINFWARFGDGNHAYKLLQMLLTPDRTAPNLFDLHPPFQIDGNFGAVSGVCEMLVQSHEDDVVLLPALPSVWPNGHVRGIVTRHGVDVEMQWDGGDVTHAVLTATRTGTVTVRSNAPLRLKGGHSGHQETDLTYVVSVPVTAGHRTELERVPMI